MDNEARSNDPGISKFAQPDVIIPNLYNPQALNHYSYTLNNPLIYTDPTGHRPIIDEDENGNPIVDPDWRPGRNRGRIDKDDPPGHEYRTANPICHDYFWINCTDEEIYDYMSRWQYPGQLFWQPVQPNTDYNVFPDQFAGYPLIGRWWPDSGKIRVVVDGSIIRNVGYPSHIFDGVVDRIPVRVNGDPYVISHGYGTNTGFHLGSIHIKNDNLNIDVQVDVGIPGSRIDEENQRIGPPAFNIMDKGLLLYTTIIETWQSFTGSQQPH